MIIGPKYKIARRLGAPIFEKTQTQKFKASSENRAPRKRATTNFAIQLNEKQKARFTYGVTEKQFSKYAKSVIAKGGSKPHEKLFELLESRLDNAVYRIGLATTRSFARQLVSHAHIMINGKKVNIPSYQLSADDVISIREGSKKIGPFKELSDKLKDRELPIWLVSEKNNSWKVTKHPSMEGQSLLFDLELVIQYYKR